jgi:hypothetical protein
MFVVIELLAGLVAIAVGSYVYWIIGQDHRFSPRWRAMPGVDVLVVGIVLGGWAVGGSLVVHSIAQMVMV